VVPADLAGCAAVPVEVPEDRAVLVAPVGKVVLDVVVRAASVRKAQMAQLPTAKFNPADRALNRMLRELPAATGNPADRVATRVVPEGQAAPEAITRDADRAVAALVVPVVVSAVLVDRAG